MTKQEKIIIGSTTIIDIVDVADGVPAKVDTGADNSSIWASTIYIDKEGQLHYILFGPTSLYFNGEEYVTDEYSVATVISSTGHKEIRYQIYLPTLIKGKLVKVKYNLSNRVVHHFPVLIGRKTLKDQFLVDVSERPLDKAPIKKRKTLIRELREDPYGFYMKYHTNESNE